MRPKILLCLLLFSMIGLKARSQSMYFFQYRSADKTDPVLYDAFFVQYNTGAGFMRIRYDAPLSNELVLAEIKTHSQEIEAGKGMPDTLQTYTDSVGRPDFLGGNKMGRLPVPQFWFRLNPLTNIFEPAEVKFRNEKGEIQQGILVTNELKKPEALDKNFLSHFFSEGDAFYDGLTQSSTRSGGFITDIQVKLHLIIVANTRDPTVGKSASLDRNTIQKTFDTICKYSGIKMATIAIISGENYNLQNVNRAIDGLSPGENDIVVFYYSGHGFRKETDSRQFPYIDLRPIPDGTFLTNSLNIFDVFQRLTDKPKTARLNLVISDCCNTKVEDKKPIGKSLVLARGSDEWSQKNFTDLFLSHDKKNYLFTAADVGQEAGCDTTSGGSFFTLFFKAALDNNLAKTTKATNWDQVFAETKEATEYKIRHICCSQPCIWANGCVQNPVKGIIIPKSGGFFKHIF